MMVAVDLKRTRKECALWKMRKVVFGKVLALLLLREDEEVKG